MGPKTQGYKAQVLEKPLPWGWLCRTPALFTRVWQRTRHNLLEPALESVSAPELGTISFLSPSSSSPASSNNLPPPKKRRKGLSLLVVVQGQLIGDFVLQGQDL